jgi:type IV secretory pathway TraG/TraD family ATPase VirD4
MVTLTETTDIDLDEFKNRKFTFYLAVPSRSRDSKLIGSLMVNFLLDHILEIREQMKYPVTMLLDEFTNFGKISGIGDTLSIIRKNKIGLILGFQNYAQLEQVYSRREAQIIIDMPATQVYFKQKTFKEAKELSEAIGRTTIEEASVSDSGRVQEFIQGRALITPDELISLKDEVIVFTADTRPLRLPLTSPTAYEQALAYEAPAREKHMVSEFVRKRGHLARSQEKGWEGNDQQDKELQEKDPPAERDERPSSNNNQNKASQNKTSQNKNSKKSDGRFERQKPTAPEKNYSEKEPEERKTYKKPDRAPGAPDFR